MFKFEKVNPTELEKLQDKVERLENQVYYLLNKERLDKMSKEYQELVKGCSAHFSAGDKTFFITNGWYDYTRVSETDMLNNINKLKVEACEKKHNTKKKGKK